MKHKKGTFPDSTIHRIGHRDPVIDKTEFLGAFDDLPRELRDKAFRILQADGSELRSDFRDILVTLDEQLRFERLVTNISSKFIKLENEQLNEAIPVALGEVSQFMGSDLSTFIELNYKTGLMQHTHQWAAPGVTFDINFIDIDIYKSGPWVARELTKLEPIVISCLDDFPKDAAKEKAMAKGEGIKSVVWVPIAIDGTFIACLALNSLRREMAWSNVIVRRLKLLGEVFANSLIRCHEDHELKKAFQKIRQLKKQLERENVQLRSELDTILGNPEIIGSSSVMQRLSQQLEQVAKTDTSMLLLGETGTGKGLIARSLHSRSRRRKRPLIVVNCAALPTPLIESELFGHEKGAFTGATNRKIGRFELADGGTLLLDEIGDLPQELQAKLLRVLQEGEFERVGSAKTLKVDVWVIAATNRDLGKMVDEGAFRADLYYRLSVFPITIPPLRLRRDDIPLLVWYIVEKLQSRFGKRFKTISRQDMEVLTDYDWPGNVRELSNVVERALILSAEPRLEFGDVMNHHSRVSAQSSIVGTASGARLEDIEREHIIRVLQQCGWRVRGEGGAAERLGLKRSTLVSRMKKLGIQRPEKMKST